MLSTFTLLNKIRVATYSLPNLKSVHIRVSSKVGSLMEEKSESGLAHFMEHILLQGTPSYPTVQKLSEQVELLAGNHNASTSNHIVSYFITLPATHLEDGLKIASEVFFDSLFPKDAITREKGAVLNEIKSQKNTDGFRFWNFFKDERYSRENPLTRLVTGEPEIVQNFTRDQIIAFSKRYLVPENTSIFICVNLDPKKIRSQLSKTFMADPVNKNIPSIPKLTNSIYSGRKITIDTQPSMASNRVSLSLPSLGIEAPLNDRISQAFLSSLLANLRTSRLFRKLRQETGLVYSVRAYETYHPDCGLFEIFYETTTENVEPALKITTATINDLLENGPSDEEFDRVQNYRMNTVLMTFDHPSSIAEWIEGDLLWEDGIELPEKYNVRLKKITKNDLINCMKNYWDFNKLNLIIQGPLEGTPEVKKNLDSILNPW